MVEQIRPSIIIIGAGPVGLLTAVRLGRAGISTVLVERHGDILPTTRAVVYQPIVVPALREIGVLSAVVSNAYRNYDGITWRSNDGEVLGHLPVGIGGKGERTSKTSEGKPGEISGFDGIILLGQQRFAQILLEEVAKYPTVEIRWSTSVTNLRQPPLESNLNSVTVDLTCHRDNSKYQIETSWVLATDGANSKTRDALGLSFDGFTWPDFKMIGADVWHDFAKSNGFKPMNFIVDPDKWAVIIYTGQDRNGEPYGNDTPLWRIAYGVPRESSDDPKDIYEECLRRVSEYARGTKPEDIQISRAEPYLMNQRSASEAYKGHVFLAGDALHSNNPIGGLGLTTGIVDACAYGNAFVRVIANGEPEQILASCANSRLDVWREVTNPVSIANLRRLYSTDEEAAKERELFFDALKNDDGFAAKQAAHLKKIANELFTGNTNI